MDIKGWISSVNKKVFVTAVFVAVIFLSGMLFVIINNANNAFRAVAMNIDANTRATVSGNGGNAVLVGNYLYYVGNYVETSDIKYKQNEYNKVTFGAIYRIKLEADTPQYFDEARFASDPAEYLRHQPKNVQLIVPKVAGFENSALYVFDKHLIYTSPNNTKDKYGNLQTNKIDFYRVDLDGRNNKRFYTTSSDFVGLDDFTVVSFNKKVYLLINDNNKLLRVSVTNGIGDKDVISDKATSWAFPVVSSYAAAFYENGNKVPDMESIRGLDKSYSGAMRCVYFTEEYTEDEQKAGKRGNKLIQYEWYTSGKGTSRVVGDTYESIYEVRAIANGRVMYSISAYNAVEGDLPSLYITSDTTREPFSIDGREGYKVFDFVHGEEKFYLPSERDGEASKHRFVSVVSVDGGDSFMNIYDGSRVSSVSSVSSILRITASTIYYNNTDGKVVAVDFDGAQVLQPCEILGKGRVTVFSTRTTGDRYFYIRDFTQGDSTTNAAVMVKGVAIADLTVDEFVLMTIDDVYLPENMRES